MPARRKQPSARRKQPDDTLREIHPDVLYRLDEIKKRAGLGSWAMRAARRNGLRVIYRNARGWVLGRDFIEYMMQPEQTDGRPVRTNGQSGTNANGDP
jgi:hypothetical protein